MARIASVHGCAYHGAAPRKRGARRHGRANAAAGRQSAAVPKA